MGDLGRADTVSAPSLTVPQAAPAPQHEYRLLAASISATSACGTSVARSKMRSARYLSRSGTTLTRRAGITTAGTYARPIARRARHAANASSLIPNTAAILSGGQRAWSMTVMVSRSRVVASKVIARSHTLKSAAVTFCPAERRIPRIVPRRSDRSPNTRLVDTEGETAVRNTNAICRSNRARTIQPHAIAVGLPRHLQSNARIRCGVF